MLAHVTVTGGTRRRGAALRDAIHQAVLAELAESGLPGLTMERVAERAGAGKATLYRYWPNRTELVIDALDHRMTRLSGPPDTGSLRGDLLEVLGAIASAMNDPTGCAVRACLEAMSHDPVFEQLVRDRLIAPRRELLLDVLRRAVARGQARPGAATPRIAEVGPMLLHAEVLLRGGPLAPAVVEGIIDDVLLPLLRP